MRQTHPGGRVFLRPREPAGRTIPRRAAPALPIDASPAAGNGLTFEYRKILRRKGKRSRPDRAGRRYPCRAGAGARFALPAAAAAAATAAAADAVAVPERSGSGADDGVADAGIARAAAAVPASECNLQVRLGSRNDLVLDKLIIGGGDHRPSRSPGRNLGIEPVGA